MKTKIQQLLFKNKTMKKTFLLSILILISFSVLSIEKVQAQTVNPINKEELTGKVWVPLKSNDKKAGTQKFNEDGSFANAGSSFFGKWEWKDDKTLLIKFSGMTWDQKVLKLSENEFVMIWKGATYHFAPKQD